MNKYKVLWDYGTEGYSFADEGFDTIVEAVDYAVRLNYSAPFLIVQVIDWFATEKIEELTQ